MMLTQLGFHYNFIQWIMSCILTVFFVVLINGEAYQFFHSKRGLRQGCRLSPLLFLSVTEGFIHFLINVKRTGWFKGLHISQVLYISHFLFVDDILIFYDGIGEIWKNSSKGIICSKQLRVWLKIMRNPP